MGTMKRTRLLTLVLLLAPALTFADTVTIDWTGQINGYRSTDPSPYPSTPPSDTSVSGVITLNTGLLPAPDLFNPPGVVSYSGSGFLQSSVQWAGGPFQAEPPGSILYNSLYIDGGNNLCSVYDNGTYLDSFGVPHAALLSLDLVGPSPLAILTGSGVGFTGNGLFGDVTNDQAGNGFVVQVSVDSVTVANTPATSVDEPGTAALTLLAGGLLLLTRVSRRKA